MFGIGLHRLLQEIAGGKGIQDLQLSQSFGVEPGGFPIAGEGSAHPGGVGVGYLTNTELAANLGSAARKQV